MAQKQSVRIQLRDGGEVEVSSVAVAQKHYPDATILHITSFDKDGAATTESYRAWTKREKQKADERAERAAEREKEEKRVARAAERESATPATGTTPVDTASAATREATR